MSPLSVITWSYCLDFCLAGKQVTNREEISSIHWNSFTGVLGNEVNGIWEKYTDTNDVNAVDANFQGQVLVSGDDFGLVKLFKFPCLKKGMQYPVKHARSLICLLDDCDCQLFLLTYSFML